MRAVSAPTVVIIAAGEGTRMRSALPKVLHPLCGRPLILWPVAAARAAGAGKVVVVDNPKRRLEDRLPDGVEVAIQEEPRGTGDAWRRPSRTSIPKRPWSWSTATCR
jgi:bifunctional UDP-N-acetylglucosamine pyrophosphorylase/glucosamine-1-phosphate N-acetyltransferase